MKPDNMGSRGKNHSSAKNASNTSRIAENERIENFIPVQSIEKVGQLFFLKSITGVTRSDPILSRPGLIPIDSNFIPDRFFRCSPGGAGFDRKPVFPNGIAFGFNEVRRKKASELRRLKYCFEPMMNIKIVNRPFGKRFNRKPVRSEEVSVGPEVQPVSHQSAEPFVPAKDIPNVIFNGPEEKLAGLQKPDPMRLPSELIEYPFINFDPIPNFPESVSPNAVPKRKLSNLFLQIGAFALQHQNEPFDSRHIMNRQPFR